MQPQPLSAALITSADDLDALLPAWTHLFYASRTPNPFAHPLWLTTWARHFIAPTDLYVVTLRDGEGTLMGVAPFYRRRQRLGLGLPLTRLQLLGAGRHVHLTELPQVLLQAGCERRGMRALMHFLAARAAEWDGVEVTLDPRQGWFEPQWLPRRGAGAGSFAHPGAARPCVVAPLPPDVAALRAGWKRNVKESVRRGANRLARAGHVAQVRAPRDGAELERALRDLMALHRARARMREAPPHPEYIRAPADRAFLGDVARRMFVAGHLTPYLLQVDGRPIAGRLVLHANGASFFSLSGLDPAWWEYSAGTVLTAACLERAVERGDRQANLSIGPDVAKLRWSEHIHRYQDFTVVGRHRRARLGLALLEARRAGASILRARHGDDG